MSMWCEETFDGRYRIASRIERVLFAGQSEFQRIELVETAQWGRVLMLDGMFMTSERDEFYYHELLCHPALTTARRLERVLIIGGGDGGTLREVLRYPEVEQVTLVEIDGLVIDVCREHLPTLSSGWSDRRLQLQVGDGIEFVKQAAAACFDVILLDGSDPVGPAQGLVEDTFYRDCKRLLRDGGVFALQSQSPILQEESFMLVQRRLRQSFAQVQPLLGPVPLYGTGTWSWTWAANGGEQTSSQHLLPDAQRLRHIEAQTRYYNAAIHHAAFALPNWLKESLAAL